MTGSAPSVRAATPPVPTSNRNAFAGANLGVPWSPLEGVTSMDPSDYVWSAPSPVQQQTALQHMWHQLGAWAMFQSHRTGWPVPNPMGPPMVGDLGALPVPPMIPNCMPGFPLHMPQGPWNPLQHVPSADGMVPGNEVVPAPKGASTQVPRNTAQPGAGTKVKTSTTNEQMQNDVQMQRKEAVPVPKTVPGDKCPDGFLDCMMDINDDELQQLLGEPLDTLGVDCSGFVMTDVANCDGVPDSSESSCFGLHKSPSCGSQHSETLPDDSMAFLDELDFSCLKEVNGFMDMTELEYLSGEPENTDAEECNLKSKSSSSSPKKKVSGGIRKKTTKKRSSVPTFVDDECLKELEQMLGSGSCTDAVCGGHDSKTMMASSSHVEGEPARTSAGIQKGKALKNHRRGGGRKPCKLV